MISFTEEAMAIRVGRWDCSTCGHKGNYGPHTRCKNCGAPRPKDVKFYLPEQEEIVKDEVRLKEAREGPDWHCGHCGNSNKARLSTCSSCGNARDLQSGDTVYEVRRLPNNPPPDNNTASPRKPGRTFLKLIGTVLGLILVCTFTTIACRKTQPVPVEGFRWERQTEMENYTWVTHESWDYPNDGELLASFEAIHHYDHVYVRTETRTREVQIKVGETEYVCGQRDLGNGYFEDEYCSAPIYETQTESYQEDIYEDIPVYQTKYRYRIMEWIYDHTIKATGNDHIPVWPTEPHPGAESSWREGLKHEKFWVILTKDEMHYEEEVPFSFWQDLKPGEDVPVVTYFGIWGGIDKTRAGIIE